LLLTYMLIMGWLPIAVNTTTMIFLTVGTIPAVHAYLGASVPSNIIGAYCGLGLGAVFFGALGLIGAQIGKRRAASAAAAGGAEPVSV
jgi:hypothetical protein